MDHLTAKAHRAAGRAWRQANGSATYAQAEAAALARMVASGDCDTRIITEFLIGAATSAFA
jgi:hypothetical protein